MNKAWAHLACAAALLFFSVAPGSTQVSSRDRILRSVDSANTAAVRGTAHPLAQSRFDQGRSDPSQQLNGVSLVFRLSPAQQADLNRLLREQQDPSSPNYHKWLTPEQYAARFGMTANDLAKVTSWLQSQGLTVDGISRSRTEVSFSGTVGQVEYALKTEIHNYSIEGEAHFANATDVALPAAFASEVLGVRGLNNFQPKSRLRRVSPRFTSSISGNHFLVPGDFATIYDLSSLYSAGIDGTGETIAIIGQTLVSTTDIDAFRTAAGLPARTSSNFQQILVPGTGTATTCSGDENEADLDLEWSEGVAKNATIDYVYVGLGSGTTCKNRTSNVFDALQYAINNVTAPIISISYGNCEANLGASFVRTMQQWAQQANAQGKTISGPAGDDGAADCDSGVISATHGLAVDVPASIPEVTGVGGAEFTGDPSAVVVSGCAAPTTFWAGSTAPCSPSDTSPTALSYIPETTWNDPPSTSPPSFSAGGGGASNIFGKPSWQSGTGVPNDGKRDVPDVALNASPVHDPYLYCTQGSCVNGFRDANNNLAAVGGTSVGAPTFAGIVALINQKTASSGLGNVNPMLYSLAASSPSAFHDITSGNNKVPCTTGTKNCASGGTIGFSAGAGYDQATGLGSLDVANLVAAWVAATPSPDFSLESMVSSVSAPGQQGTSTISVNAMNGFTGTVDLTCSPSSTTAKVTCSLNPTSVSLTSSTKAATATLSITTVAELQLPPGARPRGLWFSASGGTLFAVVILGGIPSRRRLWTAIFGLLLLGILGLAVSCGGGSGSSSSQMQQSQGTPAGAYVITVTGMSGTTSHSTAVSFTVQ